MPDYDMYENIQMKVGPCDYSHYRVGMVVPIPDGIYLSNEGAVVIKKQRLVCTLEQPFVTSKWGDEIYLEDILNPLNPVKQVIRREKRRAETDGADQT